MAEEDIKNTASNTVDKTKEMASNAFDKTKDTAKNMANKTKDFAKNGVDTLKNASKDAVKQGAKKVAKRLFIMLLPYIAIGLGIILIIIIILGIICTDTALRVTLKFTIPFVSDVCDAVDGGSSNDVNDHDISTDIFGGKSGDPGFVEEKFQILFSADKNMGYCDATEPYKTLLEAHNKENMDKIMEAIDTKIASSIKAQIQSPGVDGNAPAPATESPEIINLKKQKALLKEIQENDTRICTYTKNEDPKNSPYQFTSNESYYRNDISTTVGTIMAGRTHGGMDYKLTTSGRKGSSAGSGKKTGDTYPLVNLVEGTVIDMNQMNGRMVRILTKNKEGSDTICTYSHMDQVEKNLFALFKLSQVNGGDGVKVYPGMIVGTMGGSGGGNTNNYPFHVHFWCNDVEKDDPELRTGYMYGHYKLAKFVVNQHKQLLNADLGNPIYGAEYCTREDDGKITFMNYKHKEDDGKSGKLEVVLTHPSNYNKAIKTKEEYDTLSSFGLKRKNNKGTATNTLISKEKTYKNGVTPVSGCFEDELPNFEMFEEYTNNAVSISESISSPETKEANSMANKKEEIEKRLKRQKEKQEEQEKQEKKATSNSIDLEEITMDPYEDSSIILSNDTTYDSLVDDIYVLNEYLKAKNNYIPNPNPEEERKLEKTFAGTPNTRFKHIYSTISNKYVGRFRNYDGFRPKIENSGFVYIDEKTGEYKIDKIIALIKLEFDNMTYDIQEGLIEMRLKEEWEMGHEQGMDISTPLIQQQYEALVEEYKKAKAESEKQKSENN